MNPYAKNLGNRDAREVIAETPGKLKKLAGELAGAKESQSYRPGKWTAREILCHLADCEIAFGFRLRQAAAEENHVIQPFDQEVWAARYSQADMAQAMEVFSVVREWNVAFVKGLPPEALTKSVTHPERGVMTLETIVQTMGGHDLNHLDQLETIAGGH